MAVTDNASLGPPPLSTPIVASEPTQVGWAAWFNRLQQRVVELKNAVLGAASLTDQNRLTKVGTTSGTLAESSITDDGTTVSTLEPIVTGDTTTAEQFKVVAPTGKSAVTIDFQHGTYLLQVNRSGVALAVAYKNTGGALVIQSLAGAGTLSDILFFTRVGVGGSPSYPLDIQGDINTTTGYRQGGFVGLNTTILLAKLTPTTGTNGSITVRGGIVTGYTAPT